MRRREIEIMNRICPQRKICGWSCAHDGTRRNRRK
nr:MAG TPA: hypothetical protein [Caudoviricetes sp.]